MMQARWARSWKCACAITRRYGRGRPAAMGVCLPGVPLENGHRHFRMLWHVHLPPGTAGRACAGWPHLRHTGLASSGSPQGARCRRCSEMRLRCTPHGQQPLAKRRLRFQGHCVVCGPRPHGPLQPSYAKVRPRTRHKLTFTRRVGRGTGAALDERAGAQTQRPERERPTRLLLLLLRCCFVLAVAVRFIIRIFDGV